MASSKSLSNLAVPDRCLFEPTDTVSYIWDRLGLPREALNSLRLEDPRGQTYYPSSFKLDHLAQSTIGLSALAAALVQSTRTQGKTPEVTLPVKHACLEFVTERLYTIDGEPPKSTWGPIGGLHATADGHVRVHDNFPHHRYGALKLLGLSAHASRDEVAEKVRRWKRFELENQAAEHGLAIYALRSYEEWDATPQAAAVSDLPIQLGKISDEGPNGLPAHVASHSDRCLRGLRIVELSRVVAAPVAGKTLAAHGADVLWITSPNLPDLPDLDRNLSQGKRTIQLDLNTESDRETLRSLLKEADVFLQGYRPSSLAAKGFSTADLLALKPGIIVANLSAFGPDGPWAGRRGFDSLVQTCSGMNVSEAEHVGDGTVAKPLPCQALDHTAGYLLATGVAAAVYKRAAEGGSWQVDVSLAGVMKYLRSLGQRPEREGFERAVGLPNVAEVLEDRNLFEEKQSGFGMIKALKHAARVDGAVTGWDHMPKPLGSDEARWL